MIAAGIRARRLAARLLRDERGATSIEYALIAVGIAVAILATVFGAGTNLRTNFYDRIEEGTAPRN